MKKFYLFATLIAATAFGLTGCSDSNGGDSPSGGDGESVTSYLSVRLDNVGTVPGMGSKPFTRQTTYNQPGIGDYTNGTTAEGSVSTVRFYFFNSDGSAFPLSNNSGLNYLDEDVTLDENGDNTVVTGDKETVERKTNVMVIIRNERGALPARVAVVANKSSVQSGKLPDNTSLTESELSNLTYTTNTYATKTTDGTENHFLMSNSVYLDESSNTSITSNTPLVSTPIDASSFKSSETDAKNNPISIYVERVVARVDVNVPTSENWVLANTLDNTNTYSNDIWAYKLDMSKSENELNYVQAETTTTTNADGTTTTVNQGTVQKIDQLYVVVKGWGLADENNNGAIEKTLAQSYSQLASTTDLQDNPLSVAAYHRSFWETRSAYATTRYTFNNYIGESALATGKTGTAYGKNLSTASAASSTKTSAYTFPNTPTETYSFNDLNRRTSVTNDDYYSPTKVVVAAQLMYVQDGKLVPAEISTYRNRHYLSKEDVMKVIANDVAHSTANNIYKKSTAADGTVTYTAISENDFTLEAGDAGTEKSYKLTPTLKSGTYAHRITSTSATSDNRREYDDITQDAAQKALENVAGTDITIYTSGDTYYYTTLQHIWYDKTITNNDTKQSNIGAWGVVRNHLYKVTLNSITGWGTPVYKPDEEIIPITPTDENVYLGAQINVLQWRVVEQTANIDGTPVVTNP